MYVIKCSDILCASLVCGVGIYLCHLMHISLCMFLWFSVCVSVFHIQQKVGERILHIFGL
jgi:hypothetical protein